MTAGRINGCKIARRVREHAGGRALRHKHFRGHRGSQRIVIQRQSGVRNWKSLIQTHAVLVASTADGLSCQINVAGPDVNCGFVA